MRNALNVIDRSRRTAPQIYEYLYEKIISLEIAPNTVLSRADLQSQFGVSQTPVRDALMRLEGDGLVDIFPQHATLVTRINIRAARQAHFLRLAVELETLALIVAKSPDADIERFKLVMKRQRRALEDEDINEFADADRAFHRLFYELADVPDLWSVVRSNGIHIDRLRHLNLPLPGKVNAVLDDHAAIVDALLARDVEAARVALRRHLSGTLGIIDQIRERFPDYLTDG
ncbi:putative Uncharacterized HTH-type transcriptional regulator in unstable DNA locus [Hyphomicrobiales bacterium]|nr:putative Uncharacterized HTH-type transcriptional regulator in unstable DNA locus [Hyphomicrobiales bacterium]CAH1677633.1 putative Uncharacterized HTH-type transcriptional regulator in unstable DNA locus [Hyphomicrobiales bacterium]